MNGGNDTKAQSIIILQKDLTKQSQEHTIRLMIGMKY